MLNNIHPVDMERLDSTAIFSFLKNEDGENLLPFDELAALLDVGPDMEAPDVPLITTAGPGSTIIGANEGTYEDQKVAAVVPGSFLPTSRQLPSTEADGTVPGPSTSGGDSDHTRAPRWGSNPSSEGADSDDLDMEDGKDGDAGAPSGTQTGAVSGGRSARSGRATSGVKKRRQRNAEQMESNRVAQQKYRQRKKQEQSVLQQAVDMLTAQVAALKAVEVRAVELEASNASLQATVSYQSSSLQALQHHSAAQAAELEATRAALSGSQALVESQSQIILDQQAKLRLQEQVIASLKDRLKERIDDAMQHVVPGTVCEKMVAAVKATLYGAKDVHGLQETLAQLPDHLVTELCKNIFQVCKETWPELRTRCGRQVGGPCMTGAA